MTARTVEAILPPEPHPFAVVTDRHDHAWQRLDKGADATVSSWLPVLGEAADRHYTYQVQRTWLELVAMQGPLAVHWEGREQ